MTNTSFFRPDNDGVHVRRADDLPPEDVFDPAGHLNRRHSDQGVDVTGCGLAGCPVEEGNDYNDHAAAETRRRTGVPPTVRDSHHGDTRLVWDAGQVDAGQWQEEDPAAAGIDHMAALVTLQFKGEGRRLFDARPATFDVHLARYASGEPRATLCGIDLEPRSGWTLGEGQSGPGIRHQPCPGCVASARQDYPGLPVIGTCIGHRQVAAELGVPAWSWGDLR